MELKRATSTSSYATGLLYGLGALPQFDHFSRVSVGVPRMVVHTRELERRGLLWQIGHPPILI